MITLLNNNICTVTNFIKFKPELNVSKVRIVVFTLHSSFWKDNLISIFNMVAAIIICNYTRSLFTWFLITAIRYPCSTELLNRLISEILCSTYYECFLRNWKPLLSFQKLSKAFLRSYWVLQIDIHIKNKICGFW